MDVADLNGDNQQRNRAYWEKRIETYSKETINFLHTEEDMSVGGKKSHVFHCDTCDKDIKSQYPVKGSSGVYAHWHTKGHQVRVMQKIYFHFRLMGGPVLVNLWDMLQHPNVLNHTLTDLITIIRVLRANLIPNINNHHFGEDVEDEEEWERQ